MTRKSLSALLIVRNEAGRIARALNSLNFCDEIIVVDAESTDATAEIAKDPNAPWHSKMRFFKNPWAGFRSQRNFALQKATHPFVLVLDADEEVSPELQARLLEILSDPIAHPYWQIRRQEYFLRKPIHFGVWNPSFQDRFFLKDGITYQNEVHEYPVFPIKPLRIEAPILHDPEMNIEQFLNKMNHYTSIEAQNLYNSGHRSGFLKIVSAGPAMFVKNLIYYEAFRDGVPGLMISLLEGLSRMVRHLKIWQLARRAKYSHG